MAPILNSDGTFRDSLEGVRLTVKAPGRTPATRVFHAPLPSLKELVVSLSNHDGDYVVKTAEDNPPFVLVEI
jgi:hypothetical protein